MADNNPTATLTFEFANEDRDDPARLAEWLFLFRGVYAAAIRAGISEVPVTAPSLVPLVRSVVEHHIALLTPLQIDALFSLDLGDSALQLEAITHESPLKVTFIGAIGALVTAVIFSGGHLEANFFAGAGVKVELPSLGEGIKKFRESLQPAPIEPPAVPSVRPHRAQPPEIAIGFGVKRVRFWLSPDEVAELRRQEDSTARDGGFQRFLVSLKTRVKRTGQLDLTPSELERIERYIAAGGGGWQSRLEKIFGRHLRQMFPPRIDDEL